MGIPRLTQDLHPYASRVDLGTSATLSTSTRSIQHLVIDGPSLVYLIYNKLLASSASRCPALEGVLPSNSEINQGFHHFLTDLEENGVRIHHIFFDGGLPISKRLVRLDRMDKVRLQLEGYRTLHPLDPMVVSRGDINFEAALWTTPTNSPRNARLPSPPFMVASAIESLWASKWMNLVSIVPGEADSFCAEAVREISGAVLTNDSDLAVHDLGPNGSMALLGSIEKRSAVQGKDQASLTILSLHPQHVAERLGVPSLIRFGFERYLDPSVSTAIVIQRVKDGSRLEALRKEYDHFAEQYLSQEKVTEPTRFLNDVDPRTAELIVSFPISPSISLTPIPEDPTRDSSWSYGADIRKLAFSILAWSVPGSHQQTMTECARRGPRIASTMVLQLSETEVGENLLQIISSLNQSFPIDSSNTPAYRSKITDLLDWYMFAAEKVQQQKLELGKQPTDLSLLYSTLGLVHGQPSNKAKVSWGNIHFLGNMYAVLYSLRMLKQISEYVLRDRGGERDPIPRQERQDAESSINKAKGRDTEKSVEILIRELCAKLKTMPHIEDLFLDVADLRSRIRGLNVEIRNIAVARLANPESVHKIGHDDEHASVGNNAEAAAQRRNNNDTRIIMPENEKQWMTAKRKRKKPRKSKLSV